VTGHKVLDRALPARALVYGSLPPEGRDIDLLVRPEDARAAEEAIMAAGFLRRDALWARFAECTVTVVELTSAADWSLPAAEIAALFAEARPLAGLRRLARPAPHHALLILARRVAREGGGLDEKHRRRLDAALEEDPTALEGARSRATAWNAGAALERLATAHRGTDTASPPSAPDGRSWRPARPHRGAVIALSGLDGAGKSTQALALKATLERLGYDVTIGWTRIAWDDTLWRLALPAKALLQRVLALTGAASGPLAGTPTIRDPATAEQLSASPDVESVVTHPDDSVRRLREASGLLTHAWTLVIAVTNGLSQRRLTRSHLRSGGVVICDRYTLDSIVALRFAYGPERRFRVQRAVISALSPRPLRAYLLDVQPETAFSRKAEGGVAWLTGHRWLYRQEHVDLGVRLLDGERPPAELCAEIALDVWQSGLPAAR
jgi:hypothetical protein